MAAHPDELRADLQEVYGVDIDRALYLGEHSVAHVAALAVQLPSTARVCVAENPDAAWGMTDVLLAHLINLTTAINHKKGTEPTRIGPKWMREAGRRVKAMVMSIPDLETKLAEFERRAAMRRAAKEGGGADGN